MIDFGKLEREFENKLHIMWRILEEEEKFSLTPYVGYVSLKEQALKYCEARLSRQVEQTISLFSNKNRQPFLYIASLLANANKPDLKRTNVGSHVWLPGFSLNNWGLQVDVRYELPNKGKDPEHLEKIISDVADRVGLEYIGKTKENKFSGEGYVRPPVSTIDFFRGKYPCKKSPDYSYFESAQDIDLRNLASYE